MYSIAHWSCNACRIIVEDARSEPGTTVRHAVKCHWVTLIIMINYVKVQYYQDKHVHWRIQAPGKWHCKSTSSYDPLLFSTKPVYYTVGWVDFLYIKPPSCICWGYVKLFPNSHEAVIVFLSATIASKF